MKDSKQIKHLLACVGEECGEVQQLVGKSLRFGVLDCHPKTDAQNWGRLKEEVADVIAVYEMLADRMGEGPELDRGHIRNKKEKVISYMKIYGDLT